MKILILKCQLLSLILQKSMWKLTKIHLQNLLMIAPRLSRRNKLQIYLQLVVILRGRQRKKTRKPSQLKVYPPICELCLSLIYIVLICPIFCDRTRIDWEVPYTKSECHPKGHWSCWASLGTSSYYCCKDRQQRIMARGMWSSYWNMSVQQTCQ